jgi:hypothetical protein
MIKSLNKQAAATTTERRLADGAPNSGRSTMRSVTADRLSLLRPGRWPLA